MRKRREGPGSATSRNDASECRGWGRADLMVRRRDGKPYLLEMNTAPGMTTHSLVPMSARVAGISYEALCLWLLQAAALDRGTA